jgi:hypothetical protein
MLEVLLAIKNNNMRKIPNYDPEQFEQSFGVCGLSLLKLIPTSVNWNKCIL